MADTAIIGAPVPRDPQSVDRFAPYYTEHYARVVAYARRRTGDLGAAEAVAATVFAQAWRKTRLDPPPSGWLFLTARRVLDERGAADVTLAGLWLAEAAATAPDGPPPELPADLAATFAAVDALPPADRELVVALGWDGLTTAECATLLVTSPVTVRARLTALKRSLGRHAGRRAS
ncbi:MAG: sigma-70 family RNA polymerase sigma factor [Propionibacteriaceae bacterium]|nr:sigma-70 family RNA polymerase sigma factor [Propionibacteriaceae bacterium]